MIAHCLVDRPQPAGERGRVRFAGSAGFAYPNGMAKQAASVDEAAKLPEGEAVAPEEPAVVDKPASGAATSRAEAAGEVPEPVAELESGETTPIESRFLYVDVAAQRAKQLRRGAVPRLEGVPPADFGNPQSAGHRLKLERIAMREVDAGKIVYEVPTDGPAKAEGHDT